MIITKSFASIIAALGFAILFNIKGKKLFFAALGGGFSYFIYAICLHIGFYDISSLFVSSIFFSIYSEIFARILKTPVTSFIICCLLPLVPGLGMYNAMYATITGDITGFLETSIKTLASAGSLAIGILFVSTITRQLFNFKKNHN